MAWYNVGTITVTNGSAVVTGSGTNFTSYVDAGQAIIAPNGLPYEILSVDSATQLTLSTNYGGATAAGQPYRIMPVQGYLRELAVQAAELVLSFAAVRDGVGQGIFPVGSVGTPGLRFAGDEDTGLYRSGANVLSISAGGTEVARFNSSGISNVDGTVTSPGFNFIADTDTGIYRPAGNTLALVTGGTEAIRIASTGNTEIISTTEALRLSVYTNTAGIAPQIARRARGTPTAPLAVLNNDVLWSVLASGYHGTDYAGNVAGIRMLAAEDFTSTSGGTKIEFATAALGAVSRTARMMIMPDGSVGIGTTNPAAKLHVAGEILVDNAFLIGGDTDGWGRLATTSGFYIQSGSVNSGSAVARDIIFSNMYGAAGGASVRPGTDNSWSLGAASQRWSVVRAATGTINTSDERSKQQIGAVPDEWLDAWGDVQWQRYKFTDAVQAKGDDARWHIGLVAQAVRDAFAARDLDAQQIGLLCYDQWDEQTEPIYETVEIPAVLDNDGKEIEPARTEQQGTGETRVTLEAGDRWGLRYDECQAMEAAWQRRELARKDSLIADLAARLEALEAA